MATLISLLGSTVLFTIQATEDQLERVVPAIVAGVHAPLDDSETTLDLIVFDADAKRPPSGIVDPVRRGVKLSERMQPGYASPLGATYAKDETVVPETVSKRVKRES